MKIALAGNIGSGKSTIAKELEKKGFYLLNFTQLIKEEVAKAMRATGVVGTEQEALEKFQTDKEFYRPLLISWADACGWSDGSRLTKFLEELHEKNIVLDNIRYVLQADIVKQAGFLTVKLEGGKFIDMPSERSLDAYQFDLTIPWMDNVEERMKYILSELGTIEK